MNQASREKYEIELQRLDMQFAEYERHFKRIPRYALFGLLAPLVWYLKGFPAAMVELMVTAALVGTSFYLSAVRKSENRWIRASVAREIAE
ncbi:MAG: hypothetical protein QM778_15945 [Myxococcales bacterium]